MHKYLQFIARALIKSLTYRSEILMWLVLDTIPLLVLLLVWLGIYQHQEVLKGYSLGQLLSYYWLGLLINGFSSSHFESWRVQQIREGKIDYFLTRPFSYLAELLCNDLGGKVCYGVFAGTFFTALYLVLSQWLPFSWQPVTFWQVITFLGLVVAAYLAEFLFAAIIVMLGFWFEGAEGLEHFKWIVVTLFSGWMIPISMMPPWLATIVTTLPLRYMYAIPIGVWQGTVTWHWTNIFELGFFLSSLFGIVLGLWHFARYKYSSAGG